MELRMIDKVLLKTLYLLVGIIIVAQVLGMPTVVSYMFYLTFPFAGLIWIRTIRSKLTTTDIIMVVIAAMTVINVLLNAGITDSSFSFSYFRKLIMFITTLLFLQASFKIKIDDNLSGFFIKISDYLVLFLIVSYFVFGDRMYILNGRVTKYLTFGFDNPNLTGLFLTCLYVFELYRLFSPEKWRKKVLHIFMALLVAFFVMETQSRNSLIVLMVITVSGAFLSFHKRRATYRINRFWSGMLAVFPGVFAALYISFINSKWIQERFSFLVSIGKSLDSRLAVWGSAIENLKSSPIIGAYSQISNGTGMSQMHNTHIDIACSYGIPVLILVCVLLAKYFYQKGKIYYNKENYIYILGFACVIMLGMGEAALFSGGLGIYVFAGIFLMMSEKKDTNQRNLK